MPIPRRPHPIRAILAVLLLALPTGGLARLGLPAAVGVPASLLLLTIPLAIALGRKQDPDRLLLPILRAGLVLLALAAAADIARLSLDWTGWWLTASVALITLVAPHQKARRRQDLSWRWWGAAVLVVVGVVLWRPLALTLSSDAPAHVAAILDAAGADRLQPPDEFWGAQAASADPRFGILHGIYAVVARFSGSSAADTLRWSALFFSPLWFIAHTLLMQRLGLGQRSAVVAALIFTLYAGAGRAFGLGAAGFPGSVAQTLCAFGLAGLLEHAGERRALAALGLTALSALVHPFAWWATTIVLGCAALLMLVPSATRSEATTWFRLTGLSLVGGALVLLPRILSRSEAAGGLHTQLNEVVFLGSGLFVADPFWVLRWGGIAAVVAAPCLLLLMALVPGWGRERDHLVGFATTLPVWLISLNPVAAPLTWPLVSYLVVRLGRIALSTWVWFWMVRTGSERIRNGGRASAAAALLILIGLAGLRTELSSIALHLRQPQVIDAATTSAHLDELAGAIAPTGIEWLLAAPRIGYGLRARGGPRLVLTPVAHASPNDRQLMGRLERWRELGDPTLSDDELRQRLAGFAGTGLLVDEQTRVLHAGIQAYGYVPDEVASAWLRTRLHAMDVPVLARGEDWTLFDLRDIEPADPHTDPASAAENDGPLLARGEGIGVRAVVLRDSILTRPGSVRIEVEFVHLGESPLPERLFLRLEGEMEPAPHLLRPVSKLWRKLFRERSGRSRERFGQWVIPANLVVGPERWPQGRWSQVVELPIPSWVRGGDYTLQATIHPWAWHESRPVGDFLRDEDSFSSATVARVAIPD